MKNWIFHSKSLTSKWYGHLKWNLKTGQREPPPLTQGGLGDKQYFMGIWACDWRVGLFVVCVAGHHDVFFGVGG